MAMMFLLYSLLLVSLAGTTSAAIDNGSPVESAVNISGSDSRDLFEAQLQLADVFGHVVLGESLEWLPALQGCKCGSNDLSCACCGEVKVLKKKLNLCVKVAYLPDKLGVRLELTCNGKAFIKKEVSASNPPPICAKVPVVGKNMQVCLKLYDLKTVNKTFSGCVSLKLSLVHVISKTLKIGCFNIH